MISKKEFNKWNKDSIKNDVYTADGFYTRTFSNDICYHVIWFPCNTNIEVIVHEFTHLADHTFEYYKTKNDGENKNYFLGKHISYFIYLHTKTIQHKY